MITCDEREEIKKYIPQREPFLFLDQIISIENGEFIKALKHVDPNDFYFKGHFPHQPIMPGVLIIEALAQAAAYLTFKSVGKDGNENIWVLGGIDNARFKYPVYPGNELILTARLIKSRTELRKHKVEAFVKDQLICSAEIISLRGHFDKNR